MLVLSVRSGWEAHRLGGPLAKVSRLDRSGETSLESRVTEKSITPGREHRETESHDERLHLGSSRACFPLND